MKPTSLYVELQTAEWDCGVQCYRALLASRGIDVTWEQAVGELNATSEDGTSDYWLIRALGARDIYLTSLDVGLWLSRVSKGEFAPAFVCLEHGAHWCLALASPTRDVIVLFDPEVGLACLHVSKIKDECVGVLSI